MIGVLDYKAGNAPSVVSALRKLGLDCELVSTPENRRDWQGDSSGSVLPRQPSHPWQNLGSLRNWKISAAQAKAFLGICVGMQILFEHSEELDTKCLGWLKGRVRRFLQRCGYPRSAGTESVSPTAIHWPRGSKAQPTFTSSTHITPRLKLRRSSWHRRGTGAVLRGAGQRQYLRHAVPCGKERDCRPAKCCRISLR